MEKSIGSTIGKIIQKEKKGKLAIGEYRVYFHGHRGESALITLYKKEEVSCIKKEAVKVVYLRFGVKAQKNVINWESHSATLYYPWKMFPLVLDMIRTNEKILLEWEAEDNISEEDNVWAMDKIWVTTDRIPVGG
jgi:hypothetical protein